MMAQEEQTLSKAQLGSLLGFSPSEKPGDLLSTNRRRPRGHTAERGIHGTRRLIDRHKYRDRRIDFAADGDKHLLDAYGEQLASCRRASKKNLCRRVLLPGGFSRLFPVHLKVREIITTLLHERFLHTLGEARGAFLSYVSVCSMPSSKLVQHWLA